MCAPKRRAVTRNHLIDTLIFLGIAAVGVVTWKLQPKADVSLALSSCDPSERPCLEKLPGEGKLELALAPRPVPTLKPLTIQITVSGIRPDKVEVDFAGVAMSMGYNRPQLKPVAPGRFEGRTSLPVCVTGRMEWRATVLLENGRKVVSIPFQFHAGPAS